MNHLLITIPFITLLILPMTMAFSTKTGSKYIASMQMISSSIFMISVTFFLSKNEISENTLMYIAFASVAWVAYLFFLINILPEVIFQKVNIYEEIKKSNPSLMTIMLAIVVSNTFVFVSSFFSSHLLYHTYGAVNLISIAILSTFLITLSLMFRDKILQTLYKKTINEALFELNKNYAFRYASVILAYGIVMSTSILEAPGTTGQIETLINIVFYYSIALFAFSLLQETLLFFLLGTPMSRANEAYEYGNDAYAWLESSINVFSASIVASFILF